MDPLFEKRLEFFRISSSPNNIAKNSEICNDRFIPIRKSKSLWFDSNREAICNDKKEENKQKSDQSFYSQLLKNELFTSGFVEKEEPRRNKIPNSVSAHSISELSSSRENLLKFKSPKSFSLDKSPFNLSPVTDRSQKLLYSPKTPTKKISTLPYKVMNAPGLSDDFYLNLVDWSCQDLVAVGLGSRVYIWNATSCLVLMYSDVSSQSNDSVTSVAFSQDGNLLSIGTDQGMVHVVEIGTNKTISSRNLHNKRIGSLHWHNDLLASGSKDRSVQVEERRSGKIINRMKGHKQEVCGLKWSPDGNMLASGSNDNKLLIWSLHGNSNKPFHSFHQHSAAVKAISWSPHHHGLLASGGGTADRTIRFWNTLSGGDCLVNTVDTGSQVCALAWSPFSNELVSTHGYAQNEVILWKFPLMKQVSRLSGHLLRVLYLAVSPDGESVVTGAGDDTLRFWKVFTKPKIFKAKASSLNLFSKIR